MGEVLIASLYRPSYLRFYPPYRVNWLPHRWNTRGWACPICSHKLHSNPCMASSPTFLAGRSVLLDGSRESGLTSLIAADNPLQQHVCLRRWFSSLRCFPKYALAHHRASARRDRWRRYREPRMDYHFRDRRRTISREVVTSSEHHLELFGHSWPSFRWCIQR